MQRQRGFSLVELAIVILVLGLIVGGLAMPLSAQRESKRIRDVVSNLDDIREALEGYAVTLGHLPCPATPASNGLSDIAGGACTEQHGFVPASTLGLTGLRNADNLLLDEWANPIRYSVSATDVDGDGNWDFVSPGEMSDVTIAALVPDLSICSTSVGSSPTACANAASTLSSASPALIYSMGTDWATFTSADQQENVGATLGGGASGTNYPVAADIVFVSRRMSKLSGDEFDDIVTWVAPSSLYHRMVTGGQLP